MRILRKHDIDARFIECTTSASKNGYNQFTLPLDDRQILIQKVQERGQNKRTILTVTMPALQKPFEFTSSNGKTAISWDGTKLDIRA